VCAIIQMMTPVSDEELVQQFQSRSAGSEAAANELFQRYHSRVATWCYRFTGDRESALDLAQDVFARVYRNLENFRGQSKFSTWLYSVARNHCINEMKSRAVRPDESSDTEAARACTLRSSGRNRSRRCER
jgi:RNA polymerase sigma factor (sigma-70 family)